ncbi:MAG: transcriptional regulator [Parcubacteria group bacterium]|nr:transcriptional regulator [Parcubacteria group bacterium]
MLALEKKVTKINKSVGSKIRQIRNKKGWSQEQLAFEANLHRAYIGQVERGEKNMGIQNLENISRALGISIKKMFD